MFKIWYLRLHGWIALIFSLPMLALVLTGLVLSVEPIMQVSSLKPGSITTEKVLSWLDEHDKEGKARSISHRPYDHSLSIEGAGPDGEVEIDLRTGKEFADDDNGYYWADQITWARRTHEHLTVYNVELTIISTYVMMLVILLGILMGLPKIRNNVAGWHKATAWFLLPLVIASPLTGLFISHGVTLNFSPAPAQQAAPAQPRPAGAPQQGRPQQAGLPVAEAVKLVGAQHDLSNLIWLRQRGGRQLARIWEGGEARVYAVTREGLVPANRNFSRLFHEGNFAGIWSGIMNVVISFALILLTLTGAWLFVTKQIRKYRNRRLKAEWAKAQPAE